MVCATGPITAADPPECADVHGGAFTEGGIPCAPPSFREPRRKTWFPIFLLSAFLHQLPLPTVFFGNGTTFPEASNRTMFAFSKRYAFEKCE